VDGGHARGDTLAAMTTVDNRIAPYFTAGRALSGTESADD
jgi:hypothetical protein